MGPVEHSDDGELLSSESSSSEHDDDEDSFLLTVPHNGFSQNPDCFSVYHPDETYALSLIEVMEAIGAVHPASERRGKQNAFTPKKRKACLNMVTEFDMSADRAYVRTWYTQPTNRKVNHSYLPTKKHYNYYLPIYLLPLFLVTQCRSTRLLNEHSSICRFLINALRDRLIIYPDDIVLRHAITQMNHNMTRAAIYADDARNASDTLIEVNTMLADQLAMLSAAHESNAAFSKIVKESELIRAAGENLQQALKNMTGNEDSARKALMDASANQMRIVELEKKLAAVTSLEKVSRDRRIELDKRLKANTTKTNARFKVMEDRINRLLKRPRETDDEPVEKKKQRKK